MLVNEALTEFVYDASLADLSYNLASYSDGVWFSVKGYNDKLSVFARHVLLKAKDFVVHKDRLEVMKEQVSLQLFACTDLLDCVLRDDRLSKIGPTYPWARRTNFPSIMGITFSQTGHGRWMISSKRSR